MTNGTQSETAIHMQVMWNRLISVVEEQARTLVRTAFSTSVREAGDLSAGVFDEEGRMLAQAVTGTPGHVNSMAESVVHFIREIGVNDMFEGDVYITNDPWKATGHLHDITVVTPTFYGGRLIGYFACTAHIVDIGGRGFGADGREVYEEGLLIPIMKLFERGTVNRDLIKIVRNNVRENEKVVGDLYAFAACNEIGINRLIEMMQEFALSDLESIGAFILGHSERVVRERLAELPNGTYTNAMTLDGYDTPIDLRITLKINKDSIIADFTGTSPASGYGINVPLVYAKAYACYALMCAIAPEVPNNTASLSLFEATAPENCILNAQRPAPVSVRHVLGHLVPDLVFGALAEFMPERIPAEGASALWNIQFAVSPLPTNPQGQAAAMLTFNSGGTGARPGLDGLNATAFPSGVQTMPTESTEQVGPLIIWRKELRSGSGGAGRYRGGLGQTIEISAAQGYHFEFSAMFDRTQYPARGRNGGQPGKVGGVELDDGTRLRGKGRQAVPADRRLILKLPGGGGHGAPEVRDPARVEHDLRNGYILHDQVCQYGQCHKSSEQSNR